MKKEKYCSICKKVGGNLFVYSKKDKYEYYHCRECNTKRCAEYRKTPQGRLKIRSAVYRSIEKHYDKQLARLKLNYHVNAGNIVKSTTCSQCGEKTKIEAHHEDYSKPLDVIWTCRSCHKVLDRQLQKC